MSHRVSLDFREIGWEAEREFRRNLEVAAGDMDGTVEVFLGGIRHEGAVIIELAEVSATGQAIVMLLDETLRRTVACHLTPASTVEVEIGRVARADWEKVVEFAEAHAGTPEFAFEAGCLKLVDGNTYFDDVRITVGAAQAQALDEALAPLILTIIDACGRD